MTIRRDENGVLRLDGLALSEIASLAGTPTYVYDLDEMAREARELRAAFEGAPHLVAYAVKANAAGGVVRTLAREGCGADVVSGAELLVATACGIAPDAIVFSGVAKQDDEIDRALAEGDRGIAAIQIESVEEIARVAARARAGRRRARVSLRINPNLDLQGETHANIATGHDAAKFGIGRNDGLAAVDCVHADEALELVGLSTHVGSQFASPRPYLDAARALFSLAREVRADGRGRSLRFVNTGGGFGVDYGAPEWLEGTSRRAPPRPAAFVREVREEQRRHGLDDLALFVEPGRSLVAPHGVLLARVVQTKVTSAARWLMIDAGMNDLLRPALYQARHRIVPLDHPQTLGRDAPRWRVVGPVCESSDDFGVHLLPERAPEAVAILDAGAYGFVMASQYNGRQLPVEAFVTGGRVASRTERRATEAWVRDRAAAGA